MVGFAPHNFVEPNASTTREESNWAIRTTLVDGSPQESRRALYPTKPTAFRRYWGAKLYTVQNCQSERDLLLARLVIQIAIARFDPFVFASMQRDIEAKWRRAEPCLCPREHKIPAMIFHALPAAWEVGSTHHRVVWLERKRRLGDDCCAGKSLIPSADSQSVFLFRQIEHQPSLAVNCVHTNTGTPIRLDISRPSHCQSPRPSVSPSAQTTTP
jgi:hypothetical protein